MKTLHTKINWELVQEMLDKFVGYVDSEAELVLTYLDQLKPLGDRGEREFLLDLKMAVIEFRKAEKSAIEQEYVFSGILYKWDSAKSEWVIQPWEV